MKHCFIYTSVLISVVLRENRGCGWGGKTRRAGKLEIICFSVVPTGHVSGAERAKYSRSAECVLIQMPERWFHFAPVPFQCRWQYKLIHWLKQTEHRKRTRWQPKTIYCSLQTEKGFNWQALSSNKAAARQFRPHQAVSPRLIWWKCQELLPLLNLSERRVISLELNEILGERRVVFERSCLV